eukprot:PhF_6_TR12994/c0_g1_i1/m.20556
MKTMLQVVCIILVGISCILGSPTPRCPPGYPRDLQRHLTLLQGTKDNKPIHIPMMGIGTGGYLAPQRNESLVRHQIVDWVSSAYGRRIDTSFSYGDQVYIGEALQTLAQPPYSVGRGDIFITSKIGPQYPLGYNDTLAQADQVLATLNTSYVDLLLVHWPDQGTTFVSANSTDPNCDPQRGGTPQNCRRSTWKAMEDLLLTTNKVRAIGVSNFVQHHLDDLFQWPELRVRPAVNQIELHPQNCRR